MEVPKTLGDLLSADKATTPVSEKEWVGLVQSVATGDQLAFQALYERTHRIVFTLIMRIVNSRETAEEVTLDVFHDVWRRAGTYNPASGPVVGWIMNQARSRAIDRIRFEHRKKRFDHSPDCSPAMSSVSDPRSAFEVRDQADALRGALKGLTHDERQAIETAFFSELTYHEVAVKLNQPLGTVKTRVRSALGKLRQALGDTGKMS